MMVMNPLLHGQPQPHLQPPSSASSPVSVSLKPLPFYDVHAELIPPSSLPTKGSSRFQEAAFPFTLSLQQANDIALNRDMRMNAKISHLYQIQLRLVVLGSRLDAVSMCALHMLILPYCNITGSVRWTRPRSKGTSSRPASVSR